MKKKLEKMKMAYEKSKQDMKNDKGMKESSKMEMKLDKLRHKK